VIGVWLTGSGLVVWVVFRGGNGTRLFDAFLFNDELDMLELHLNEMAPVVDVFILIEAAYTFQGHPKEMHFERAKGQARFRPFLPRIEHVKVRANQLLSSSASSALPSSHHHHHHHHHHRHRHRHPPFCAGLDAPPGGGRRGSESLEPGVLVWSGLLFLPPRAFEPYHGQGCRRAMYPPVCRVSVSM
jgi:hypothetical protein